MSDINGALQITHQAGCPAPGIVAQLPMATMLGQNPYIQLVADGQGGEVFRCALCGRLQGSDAVPENAAQPEPKARKPKRSRGRLISDWPKVYQEVVAEMRRDHDALEWLNVVTRVRSNFPQASSVVESTIRRWCTEDNLPHPKDL